MLLVIFIIELFIELSSSFERQFTYKHCSFYTLQQQQKTLFCCYLFSLSSVAIVYTF